MVPGKHREGKGKKEVIPRHSIAAHSSVISADGNYMFMVIVEASRILLEL